jgi:hypothetical protein
VGPAEVGLPQSFSRGWFEMGPTNIALVKLFRADDAFRAAQARLDAAATLLDQLVSAEEFPEFLTLQAYQRLE